VSAHGTRSAELCRGSCRDEDPVFKQSHQSYMIQLADCVAFSLLKREVPPTPLIKKYGIQHMFEKNIAGVCLRAASRKDPLGIVRK
jgi:hypothetical protein